MAQRDDIRVKLTPEGLREVVVALRTVQKETDETGRGTLGLLARIKNLAKDLLPAASIAASAGGFALLVKNTLAFGDALADARIRTKASAEELSTLAFVGLNNGVAFDALEGSLARTAKAISDLRKGSPELVETFSDLGISVADLEGLNATQAFSLIAERLTRIDDAAERSALAMRIFGRSGAQLIPMLNELGTKGFAKVQEEAQKLGFVISDDLSSMAERINDSLDLINRRQTGIAAQFLTGFAPQFAKALDIVTDSADGGAEAITRFGRVSGKAFVAVIEVVKVFARAIFRPFDLLSTVVGKSLAALAVASEQALKGNFRGAAAAVTQLGEDISAAWTGATDDATKSWDRFSENIIRKAPQPEITPKVTTEGVDESLATLEQDTRQKLDALQKRLGSEQIKQFEAVAKRRAELAQAGAQQERARIEAQTANATELMAVQRALSNQEEAALRRKQALAKEAYDTEVLLSRLRAEALAQASRQQFGNTATNARVQVAIQKQALDEQLAAATTYYRSLISLNAEYLTRYKSASQAIKAIDDEIAANRRDREKTFGDIALSRLSAEEQFAERIRQAEQRNAALRAAVLAGNLEQARELHKEIVALTTDLARSDVPGRDGDAVVNVARRLREEADARLELALNLQKQAERSVADSAAKGIRSLDQQLAAAKARIDELTQQQLQGINLRVGVDQPSLDRTVEDLRQRLARETFQIKVAPRIDTPGTTIPAFAQGGRIPGVAPHPRADNALIFATPGEFMMPVRAVEHYGPQFMEQVRSLQLPRFADGGLVGGEAGDAGGRDVIDINLTVGGRSVRLQSRRDQARELVQVLRDLERGGGRQA